MGVSGLTTFLREGRTSLATSLVVERQVAHDAPEIDDKQQRKVTLEPREDEIPLVIDAWGWVDATSTSHSAADRSSLAASCGDSTQKT
jgi:hypothetical protein